MTQNSNVTLVSVLIHLLNLEKRGNRKIRNMIPENGVDKIIPPNVSPDEHDFIMKHKGLLEINSTDIIIYNTIRFYGIMRDWSIGLKVLMIICTIIAIFIVLPIILYVLYNLLQNKTDLVRSFALVILLSILYIVWFTVYKYI